jgi:hypothetical protein
MNFLRRLLSGLLPPPKRHPVPGWASFFGPGQYQTFLDLVATHFSRAKCPFTLGDGVIHVDDDRLGGKQQLGLLNLGQLCARNEEKDWPGIIADHFRTLAKSHTEQQVLEARLSDFARVQELLAVRLWPRGYLDELDRSKIIHRTDLPGTITALVFDLPSSIRNVSPQEAQAWGRDDDELFELGLANVKENCIPNITEEDLGNDITATLFADESFFVASHALLIEEHPDCLGTFGALLGIPHRHVLLAYPINDLRVIPAINRLIPIIAGMERDGPGSISRMLYWYKSGAYTELPYRIDRQTLQFTPPQDFVEMLNLLAEPEG